MLNSIRLMAAAGGVAVLALLASSCANPTKVEATSDPVEKAVPVAVSKAGREDLVRNLELAAEFRPYQEIDVHAKVAGFVKRIYVDVGDRVTQGQVLAVLEVPELNDELNQAIASVKRSESEVERARGDLQRAESAHALNHLSYNRLEDVIKLRPNLVAQQEIDEAAARDRESEAQIDSAKAALAAAEQQVGVSKANAGRVQTLLDYTRITAPFTGVITRRFADTGAMVQAGTASQSQAMPVVRLSQNDRLRLVLPVPEAAVARVHLGAPVQVRVTALKRTFEGRPAYL
jgi:multidrug efflux pump subunit AcrA (membrane-fusion protein)